MMDRHGRKTPGGRDRRCDTLPSRLNKMSDIERAWVGAFIEADGCVSWNGNSKNSRWQVAVSQVDPEPIATLLRVTGAGSVHARLRPNLILTWMLYRVREIRDIVEQCAEFCPKLCKVVR